MSTVEWPTREQVRSTLDAVLQDEDQLAEGWRAVLTRIWSGLQRLIGVEPAMHLLHDNHDSLAGEVEPGRHDRSPGIHMGVHAAEHAVAALWRRDVYRYARRAQAALNAVAAGITPDWNKPLPGENEHESSSWPPQDHEPSPPETGLPEPFTEREDMTLLRAGLAQLAAAEQAAGEERELGEYEDPDTGEIRHSLPEHQIEASQDLLAEAERWDDYLADYADTVVYTLATTLRHHLNQPAPATS